MQHCANSKAGNLIILCLYDHNATGHLHLRTVMMKTKYLLGAI